MNNPNIEKLLQSIDSVQSGSFQTYRLLSLYAASIALANEQCVSASLRQIKKAKISRKFCYEIMLQSYLFLGFPRMLIASEQLYELYPLETNNKSSIGPPFSTDEWWRDGEKLCKEIYAGSYDILKDRVQKIAPEIYNWMILEGYGKVLSRPGLDSLNRELANVAFLIVENYPSQLYSHMRGAFNMGGDKVLIKCVIDDLGDAIGDGYQTAIDIFNKLTENQK